MMPKKTIQRFGVEFPSQADEEKLISDMLKMNRLYGFGFDEYLLFYFEKKSKKERLAFVADWELTGYANAMNDSKNNVFSLTNGKHTRNIRSFIKGMQYIVLKKQIRINSFHL